MHKTDTRTPAEQREHYEIEKRLANQLRTATRSEPLTLYKTLYDELYRTVPFLKTDPATTDPVYLAATQRMLGRFFGTQKTFLEIGAGNLAVSRMVAPFFARVLALDVSAEFASALGSLPKNVELILSDGLSVPVDAGSVDCAYSHQLMEHLHPDDAKEQLIAIARTLKTGGGYLCITPHRFNGPHDISKYFDDEATGFHLHEYTIAELRTVYIEAGFRKVTSLVGFRGYVVALPPLPQILLEKLLLLLPGRLRKQLSRTLVFRNLLAIRLIGIK